MSEEWNPDSVLDWMKWGGEISKKYPFGPELDILWQKAKENRKKRGAIFLMDKAEMDKDEYLEEWWKTHPYLIHITSRKTEAEEKREKFWLWPKIVFFFLIKLPLILFFGFIAYTLFDKEKTTHGREGA